MHSNFDLSWISSMIGISLLFYIYNGLNTMGVFGQFCSDDEYECSTLNGSLTFPNDSRCIPLEFVCDYDSFDFPIPDCPLGDDEWNCSSCGNNHSVLLSPNNTRRTVDDYVCPSTNICIPYEWSCAFNDRIVDCYPNQEDVSQAVCEATNDDYIDCGDPYVFVDGDPCFGDEDEMRDVCFKCNNTNGRCINEEYVCDSIDDCLDGQDESNCPTISPTFLPSINPTIIPSNNPSILPTTIPTNIPSINPSNNPTTNPSNNPSNIPTLQPVLLNVPTTVPSEIPSNVPTTPSISPTGIPSTIPTNIPTNEPSNDPTELPSNLPTDPSINPTNNPSNVPSLIPTNEPNDNTFAPTLLPTLIPTIAQTDGECCHARDNTNRYETYCNDVTNIYITDCLSRENHLKCEWETDNSDECPVIQGSEKQSEDSTDVLCNCVPLVDDGSRASEICFILEDTETCQAREQCVCI